MCTAITFTSKSAYFGRNLDLDIRYNEKVVLTPRQFTLNFMKLPPISKHYAILGMAHIADSYPLYYDAINEKGVGMAALNFPEIAAYHPEKPNFNNVCPFEFIPYVLSSCGDLNEVRCRLEHLNLCRIPFSDDLPLTPLHWIIADPNGALTVESTSEGLKIYENPVGVLTNCPEFPFHMSNLNYHMNISPNPAENRFSEKIPMTPHSRGMGGVGLPGDFSSQSRFIRAAFVKENSICDDTESSCVNQVFHILSSVAHPRGAVRTAEGKSQITIYSSCCNLSKCIYYFTTYENPTPRAVCMDHENLTFDKLITFDIDRSGEVLWLN